MANILLITLLATSIVVVSADWEKVVYRAFDETCWEMFANRLTGNAKRVPVIKSLDVCKKFCIAKSKHVEGKDKSCSAIEWDIPSKTCFAIIGKADKPEMQGGRFHYVRVNCKTDFEKTKIVELKSTEDRKVLQFSALGQDWTVNLRRNTMVLAKDAAFVLMTPTGQTRAQGIGPSDKCFWIGTAESGEEEFGIAAFTICDEHFRGYINTPINDYEINPYSSTKETRKRSFAQVLFGRGRENKINTDLDLMKAMMRAEYLSNLEKRGDPKVNYGVELSKQAPPPGRTTYYELSVVMDGSYFKEFKAVTGLTKPREGLFYIAELTNFMQAWYVSPSFGMRVWLVVRRATLVETNVPIPKKSPLEDELNAVCRWSSETIKGDWDGTIFLTGDGTITNEHGLAIPFSACSKQDSQCGSVPTNGISMSAAVRTYAHEVAHTLGMLDLYTPGSPFYTMCYHGLMRDGASSNTWTRCSTQMYERFVNVATKTCLIKENTPGIPADVQPPLVPIDVAYRAEASMSSTFQKNDLLFGAWKAVDGSYAGEPIDVEGNIDANKDPKFHSCALSDIEKDPWLLVELSSDDVKTPIFAINIINYWEKSNRLTNFEIRVGNDKTFASNALCYKTDGGLQVRSRGSMLSVKCQGQVSGRYVSLQVLGDKEQIAICELQVLQEIQPKDFKSPYKCSDNEPNCYGFIKTSAGNCAKYAEKCAYSCGTCQRGVVAPPRDYPDLPAAKIECADQDEFVCQSLNSGNLCSTRRAILTCPKTCGKCGEVKLPPPPGPEEEPKYDPNCLDSNMACSTWIAKNPATCTTPHLAAMCKSSCKEC